MPNALTLVVGLASVTLAHLLARHGAFAILVSREF